MDLRKYNILKRFTQKNENDTNDEIEKDNQEFEQIDKGNYSAIAKLLFDKSAYYAKKGFYKGTSKLKDLKDDILGTNFFKKYERNEGKVKTNPLFAGPGYNYFKSLMLVLTLMCPTLLFVVPEIYLAFIAEYVFNAATSIKPSKRRPEKDIPLSHRQKRMISLRKEKFAKKKMKMEKKVQKAKMKKERKIVAKHRKANKDTILSNDSTFDASLC